MSGARRHLRAALPAVSTSLRTSPAVSSAASCSARCSTASGGRRASAASAPLCWPPPCSPRDCAQRLSPKRWRRPMLAKPDGKPPVIPRDPPADRIVLVLQGGGALGAYQAGTYQALHEAGLEPDWVIGTSIGAINGSIIA